MKTRSSFFLFLLLILFHLELPALSLRDRLQHAKTGDYVVTAQDKSYTLLHIIGKTDQRLSVEEITIPSGKVSALKAFDWRTWYQERASRHTSWILYQIILQSGQIVEAFSLTKNAHLKMESSDSFLPILLNLEFTLVPGSERRKIGPRPNKGLPDWRRPWHPHMVIDGKIIPGVEFTVWQAYWPHDGGFLSGKLIEIYLPEDSVNYPAYFPYWIQVKGGIGRASLRVIDSGSNLPMLPRPPTI